MNKSLLLSKGAHAYNGSTWGGGRRITIEARTGKSFSGLTTVFCIAFSTEGSFTWPLIPLGLADSVLFVLLNCLDNLKRE